MDLPSPSGPGVPPDPRARVGTGRVRHAADAPPRSRRVPLGRSRLDPPQHRRTA